MNAESKSGVLHGLWRVAPSPALTEIAAAAGIRFQIFDCEHGAYDYSTLLPDVIAAERHGCAPLVRVKGTDKVEVQRCLDLGARGIVFPQLSSPADFEAARAMMDYAPAGTRGFNPFVRGGGYGFPTPEPTRTRPWYVPIIETLEAVGRIDEILREERIDLVYIGVYDLSAHLGVPGHMDAPGLEQAVARVIAACHAARKPVCMMALSESAARRWTSRGVHALVHGVETHRIAASFRDFLAPMQALAASGGTAPNRIVP
jgi:2-keto-3-deoxy-L-rhamnonate aldolase RhmA